MDAQETRRILDRLYGYEVSPVLWRKVMPRLSAGRVQSVATRLIVDKEKERMAFRPASYWDVTVDLDAGAQADPRVFTARLTIVGKAKIAQGRDFSSTGELKSAALALTEESAHIVAGALRNATHTVSSVEARPYTRRPYAPFRTTTLQQEAGRKLGFTAQRTMSIAQDLYEGGYITYMRTDSVTLSGQAIAAARTQISDLYGPKYVPDKPRQYTSKVKNAQEAHEAIRPAGESFRTPKSSGLSGDQLRLYELVWQRTLASQMADATGEQVTITVNAATDLELENKNIDSCTLVASGRTVLFPGFLKAYVESNDDPDTQRDDQQARLPNLKQGAELKPEKVTEAGHETKAPARYTEPSLVAKLEELEIGRPSTYASIIRTITARDYVFKRGQALVPTWLAFAVTRLLEEQFPDLVDYAFTATMEADLDDIASGAAKRLDVLKQFYFGSTGREGLHQLVTELGEIDPRKLSTFEVAGDDGIVARVGKYGAYIEDPLGRRVTLNPEMAPDELTEEVARGLLDNGATEERQLGMAADTGYPIVAKDGRYGPFVTEVLPEDSPKSAKARTGSLWKSMSLDTVTLEQAEMLLSLPRVVGVLDGEQVTSQNGRYGPYVKKGTVSRSLPSEESILTVSLDEAQALFAAPQTRGASRSSSPLKELGPDPATGKSMIVKDGRFGPYVTDGEINATLKRTDSPDSLTPERAAELLAEKRAKPPTEKKKTVRRTASKKK